MKKHSGMRPQDIVVLLDIITKGNEKWLMKDLAADLNMSASEVSESLHRSHYAGLINHTKTEVSRLALFEFLEHGIRYVFPQQLGSITRGVPTAFSAAPLKEIIKSEDPVVWPHANGKTKGHAIEPLYGPGIKNITELPELHCLLALVDALRIGRARERVIASAELKKRILHGE